MNGKHKCCSIIFNTIGDSKICRKLLVTSNVNHVLHGGFSGPADTDRLLCELGAMGQQGQIPRNLYRLTELAVQRQLRVIVVTFQVQDEHSAARSGEKH